MPQGQGLCGATCSVSRVHDVPQAGPRVRAPGVTAQMGMLGECPGTSLHCSGKSGLSWLPGGGRLNQFLLEA